MALTIVLDRDRELRLDFNAMAKFEAVTGRSALAESTFSTVRALDVSALVWAAHLAYEEAPFLLAGDQVPDDLDTLGLQQIRAILTPDRVDEVQAVLFEMWGIFSPDPSSREGDSAEGPTGS